MYTLAFDNHKKYAIAAMLDDKGKFVKNTRIAMNKESFTEYINDIEEPCQAVIEAGYTWGQVYDILTELGVDVTVAHPLKVKAIASAKIKTDELDARTLAELLYANLIPEVFVPSQDIRQQKNILRQRCWFVKLKTMIKNRIHHILNRNHIQSPFTDIFGKGGRKHLDTLELPGPDKELLLQDLSLLDFLSEQIKQTEKWIEESLLEDSLYKIILSIPGFGKTLAALTALEIADISRFSSPPKLASYCGIVPSTYASGGKVYHGHLLPTCNKWLRYALIEASWTAICCSPYFRGLYSRMKIKKGSNTAIIAVARRISEVLFYCLKEQRNYYEKPYVFHKNYAV
jgi:transposase